MRIGLLGASRIARHVILDPANRLSNIEVVAVAARNIERARAFATLNAVPDVEPNYARLIARTDLDLIYIALPNAHHAEWAVRAAERGRAVLCEKPFASRPDQARAMVAAGRAADVPVLEAFHYRHHPLMAALVDVVRSGRLGRLRQAEASFRASVPTDDAVRWSADLGGGALFDLGCYAVHALRTLLGSRPEVIEAEALWRDGVDARFEGRLRFVGEVEARVVADMTADTRSASLRLIGEAGEVRVENFVAPQLPHRVWVSDANGRVEQTFEGPGTFECQLAHVRAVLSGVVAPLTGGEDAIDQADVLDALYCASGRPAGTPTPERDRSQPA